MTAPSRVAAGALAAAVALGLAACGSGGSSTALPGPFSITSGPGAGTASAPTTSTTASTPTTSSTSRSTTAARPRRSGGRGGRPGAAAPKRGAPRRGAPTRGAPSPSAPSAPSGLVATTGYATYELCQGTCTGSVPAALHRPLRIPAGDGGPCPISLRANGPVSPDPGTPLGVSAFAGSDWMGAQVRWTAAGSYGGPVLIRGRQIGGSGGTVGFGEGHTPYDELQLLDAGSQAPRVPGGGRAWLTYTRVPGPGCYAYQVDGTNFTEVFVFRAA